MILALISQKISTYFDPTRSLRRCQSEFFTSQATHPKSLSQLQFKRSREGGSEQFDETVANRLIHLPNSTSSQKEEYISAPRGEEISILFIPSTPTTTTTVRFWISKQTQNLSENPVFLAMKFMVGERKGRQVC